MAVHPYHGIQMKRKEPNETFMMISNWKKTFDLHGFYKIISASSQQTRDVEPMLV